MPPADRKMIANTTRKRVTYAQLRRVLTGLGFEEEQQKEGPAFRHSKSDTLFLFREHAASDLMQPADVFVVEHMLDEKGLLEPESFEALLSRTTA
jgi:hypothetical protein